MGGGQKTGDSCTLWESTKIRTGFWCGNLKERDHLLDLRVGEKDNVTTNLNETRLIWLIRGISAGLFAHGSEFSGTVQ